MIDLTTLKCTCSNPGFISKGDRKVADFLDVGVETAHALMDATEDCLDEAIREGWGIGE